MSDRRDHDLPRRFGLWTGVFTVIASMVGTGALVTSGYLIQDLQHHPLLLVVWLAGGALAISGGLAAAEPATAYPRAGGEYNYVRLAFGDAVGFMMAWSTFLIGFCAPIAIIAINAVDYLLAPFEKDLAHHPLGALLVIPGVSRPALATLLTLGFGLSHCLGHRESAWVQNSSTAIKVLFLVLMVGAGLMFGSGDWGHFVPSRPIDGSLLAAAGVAIVTVHYSYVGWTGSMYLAGETRDPGRNVPLSTILGCLFVTALYVALNVLYGFAIAPTGLNGREGSEVDRIAATAMSRLFGPALSGGFSLLIGVGILSSLSAYLLTGARVTLSAARDGLFPGIAGRIHPVSRTPVTGILLHAAVATGLIWVNDARTLLSGAAAGLGFMGLFVVTALYRLRRRSDYRPVFRCPGFPLTPLVYVFLTVASLTLSLFNPQYRDTTLIASGVVLLAIPLYHGLRLLGLVQPTTVDVGG